MVLSSRSYIRRSFSNAAHTYNLAAIHQKNIAEKLVEYYKNFYVDACAEYKVIDIGGGTGFVSNDCLKQFLFSSMISLDISETMLKQDESFQSSKIKLCADLQELPVKNKSIDLCLSSYAFQWADNTEKLFSELIRVLKPGGMLFFSIPGPSTFNELKKAWSEVDDEVHVHDFICDKTILSAAFKNGFKALHYSQKDDVLEYSDQKSALQHIKKIGASNLDQSRQKHLLGKQRYLDFGQAFRKHSHPLSNFSLSYESYFFGFLKPHTKAISND